jgi:hypothetical protein
MGVAETLLRRFRVRIAALFATTSSSAAFARSARRAVLRHHLAFTLALVMMSAVLDLAVTAVTGPVDARYGLLAIGYVVLGIAIFAAILLSFMGRTRRVLTTLAGAVVALAAFEVRAAAEPVSDTAALAWLTIVAAVTLVARLVLVRRYVAVPVSHRSAPPDRDLPSPRTSTRDETPGPGSCWAGVRSTSSWSTPAPGSAPDTCNARLRDTSTPPMRVGRSSRSSAKP